MKTWLLLFLLLAAPAARAQTDRATLEASCLRALALARTDSARGRLNLLLGEAAASTIDSARYFERAAVAQLTRAVAAARGDERRRLLQLLSHAYNGVALCYGSVGDRDSAVSLFRRSLALAQRANDLNFQLTILGNLGSTYADLPDYALALQALQQGEQLGKRLPPSPAARRATINCLLALGYMYRTLGEDTVALRYHLRAYELVKSPRTFEDQVDLAGCLISLTDTYQEAFSDTAHAGLYARRAWVMAQQSATLASAGAATRLVAMHRLGAVYRQEKRWRQARALLLPAQALARRNNTLVVLSQIEANLAMVEEGDGHLALALRYARQADSYGPGVGLFSRSRAAGLQAQLYEKLGKPREALAAFRRYVGLRDSLRNDAAKRRFLGQKQLADFRRRTAALRAGQALAAANLHRQQLVLWALVAGLGLLGLLAGQQWRNRRRQQQATALLAAQKAQLEEQAARLGELDEAKNQFFANVSHELRTPLTLMLGPLEGLLSTPPRPLPAAVQQPLALAYQYAQRLHELVSRILDLTKLQAGRLALHPAPTALAPLLRRLVGQFELLAGQRGVALRPPAALPEDLCLLLDADKVEQVLTNLLINALNHTPAGGTVTVETQLPGPDGQYAVTVRDTGPGIAQAEQARVFERYYQSPHGPARGGTGLGLALSREWSELLGGSLTLASEPGAGAAFTLRFAAPALPAGGAPAEAVEESRSQPLSRPAAAPRPGPRPRVLVVEDQPDLREYLRQLLAPAYEVLTAPDGQAAFDLLTHEAPVDLVTTDAMMPRLSGLELLGQLRASPTLAGIPVLMLTARADEAHRLAALTVGVDDYLTKPFVAAELLARTRALLARWQVRRQFAALPAGLVAAELPAPAPTSERPSQEAVAGAAGPTPKASAATQLAHWQALASGRLADERFGPAELAELLCLSERTLYRRLGELAGLTPAAWLRELRLAQARHLLEAGQFGSVAAVTKAVGFGSSRHFSMLYAERFGRRPSSYRA